MKTKKNQSLLYQALAETLISLIEKDTYRIGERIPSVRQMSKQQGVSISTVLQAYLLLENQGWIEARPQSGYYVRAKVGEQAPEPEISSPVKDPSQVSLHELAMMLMRDSTDPELVQLGLALPNPNYLPIEKINQALTRAAKRHAIDGHRYIVPPGLEELRIQIAKRAAFAGCQLSPNDVLITSGGLEAMDLCLHAVCRPGDIVAIESPMYFGTLQTLEVHGLRVLEIPTHPRDGLNVEALAFAIQYNPVRAVIVISNFNNPLGSQMPDEKKKELVDLLARHDIPLIENDVYGELYFGEKRPLVCKSFDKKGLVMLISAFSKDISPGLRIGSIAPGKYKTELEWLKFTINTSPPTLPQYAIADFIESGGYDHHLRRIRREYARNVELMSSAVIRHFPSGVRLTRPSGGFVLWVQLPENVDSLELYKKALASKIALAPGHVFSASNQYANFIRLNAAEFNYSIDRSLERLGTIIKEMMN
ncbi:MAG TPA: PLP-dependent aminotransferase family protein [Anaerolineales bacterium]|nr:PLP-dependent aminotransferase family protein [Anaerolineales bacterium]HNA88531.1 PLP-dependent aminotransferase family protein [Anaerolineales bacterium]HNB36997.1 PLP-dependent aminotransferase family protein [Anaerolineales bacterium]